MGSPQDGERSPWQGSYVKWSFSRSAPSLQPSSRGRKEAGGLRRNRDGAANASPRGRLCGARAPARAGRMEEGRRGSEVPESRAGGPAPRPDPTPPRDPPSPRTRRAFRVRRLSPEEESLPHTSGFEKFGNFARETLPTLQHAEKEKYVRR